MIFFYVKFFLDVLMAIVPFLLSVHEGFIFFSRSRLLDSYILYCLLSSCLSGLYAISYNTFQTTVFFV